MDVTNLKSNETVTKVEDNGKEKGNLSGKIRNDPAGLHEGGKSGDVRSDEESWDAETVSGTKGGQISGRDGKTDDRGGDESIRGEGTTLGRSDVDTDGGREEGGRRVKLRSN